MSVAETTKSGLTLFGKQSMSDLAESKTSNAANAAKKILPNAKQRQTAKEKAGKVGYTEPVAIQGGSTQKRSFSPISPPAPPKKDAKPKHTLVRSNTFAAGTASSRSKARPSTLSAVPPPDFSETVIRGGTPNKQSLSASSSPGPGTEMVIRGSPKTAASPAASPQAAIETSAADDTSFKVGRFAISTSLMTQIKKGPHADLTLKMMEAALNGGDDPEIFMESPEISILEPPPPAPASKMRIDCISSAVINLLFPPKERLAGQTVQFDDDMEIDIEPFYPTPEEIAQFDFSNEEVQAVKRVVFFRSSINDAQLIAFIVRFPNIDEIDLNLCPNLGDESLQAIASLKHLRILCIRYCPKVTQRGIRLLPLEALEEFSLSTKVDIDVAVTGRLAKSPELRRVDFNFCALLSRKALLMFKTAHEKHQIVIHVKGCDQILQEAVDSLNEERNKPIVVHRGPPEASDHFSSGLPRALEPPPSFPDMSDIFSMKMIPRVFKSSNPRILPSKDAIEEMDFAKTIPGFKGFRGVDLSGPISEDALDALFKRFPDMDLVRIYDSPNLGYGGLLPLRRLEKAEILYIGRLPGCSTRTLELIFSQDPQKTLQCLREVHLAGLPISDDVLFSLASLPLLERVTVSGCHRFTVQGFKALKNGCPRLEHLTMIDCPAIDQLAIQDFREARPQVTLEEDHTIDGTIVALAAREADQRLFHHSEVPLFFFPDPSKHDERAVTEFYTAKLNLIGMEFPDSPHEPLLSKWRLADQRLQAYANISRMAWAIVKELYRIGFFTNQDAETAPETIQGIIQLLSLHDANGVNPYVRKIKMFDLRGLGMTQLPYFILDEMHWANLKTIYLEGTHITELSDSFKQKCPKLAEIVYAQDRKETLSALLSPRTSNLPPPEDMGDSKEDFKGGPAAQKQTTKLGAFFSNWGKKKGKE